VSKSASGVELDAPKAERVKLDPLHSVGIFEMVKEEK
jgi:hypothetical protein